MDEYNLYNIQLADLNLFLLVEENASFTKAGEKLFMSQSWVSKRISRLENELGVRLFIRDSREVTLTPAGLILKQQLEGVSRTIQNAIQAAQAAQEGARGALRLGCLQWRSDFLIRQLEDYIALHPEIVVNMDMLPVPDLYAGLSANSLDLIFTFSHARSDLPEAEYHIRHLLKVPFGAFMTVSHPLAARGELEVEDLRDVPLLMLDDKVSPGHIALIRRMFLQNNIRPLITKYAGDINDHIGNVLMNKGVLLASEYFLGGAWTERIAFAPIRGAYHEVVAIWKKQNVNPALHDFLDSLPPGD
ncbi:MAG: LysR family transcriptional regulator [Clostridiales bacterium]|nr:LysR family transcriptional regulator [Clostridiales bacterium]